MDLAEDPEIRRCSNMNPKTWTYIRSGDMDLAEAPEIHMDDGC